MLISHKYKFIFLKTQNTASTSTEIFFEQHCENNQNDVENHFRKMLINEDGIIGQREIVPSRNYEEWYSHINAKDLKEKLGEEKFNTYYKFSNIRNPYDMVVARYFFKKEKYDERFKNKELPLLPSFESFVLNSPFVEELAKDTRNKIFINQDFILDDYIRYENLESDIERIKNKLNLPQSVRQLGNYKSEFRPINTNYQDLYNQETKDIVTENFGFYLEKFNYSF